MDQVPHSPAYFRVGIAGPDMADVFTGTPSAAPDEETRASSRLPNYFDDASVWWSNWVAVAATGWGALVVIAPLIATHFLVWATRSRRAD